MLAVAKRKGVENFYRVKDTDNFPCADLRTIDQLWVKYSNGRFGFSVQKRIYQSLGGTREDNLEIWEKFGDKVGWRKRGDWLLYEDITFDKKAPEGHLPGALSFYYFSYYGEGDSHVLFSYCQDSCTSLFFHRDL
jgi:hypothetical protein